MATRKRSTAKGRGGSSGGGNPRNAGRIGDEQNHEDAMRMLRAEYYLGVRDLAQQVENLVENEGMDESDAIHQVVDGSYWVIYTHANFQVLMCSDHHDAYMEDFGEVPTEGRDGLKWAELAYAALARDISERLNTGDLEESRREAYEQWDYEGYWNAVLGANRSAADVVREFGLNPSDRVGLSEWLGGAEEEAWRMSRAHGAMPEAWREFHSRALRELMNSGNRRPARRR